MNRFGKNLVVAAVALTSLSQLAFANEPVAGSVEAVAEKVPASSKEYPLTPWDRPSFLPRSAFEVSAGVKANKLNAASLEGTIGLSYGLTDRLQLDLTYSGTEFTRKGSEFKAGRTLTIEATTGVWSNDFMSLKVGAALPVNFDKEVVSETSFNMPLSFVPFDRFAIKTIHDEFIKLKYNDKKDNETTGKFGAEINVPLKVGYQVGDRLWLEASTKLASLNIGGAQGLAGSTYIGKHNPVKVKGIVAVTNWFDVDASAGFSDNVSQREKGASYVDTFNFGVGIALRGGWLNG